jgi:hypothetical protein
MRVIFHVILFQLFVISAYAQYASGITIPDTTTFIDDLLIDEVSYASTIKADDLKRHLSIIASDEMEGRETGSPGNDRAARYIAEQIKNLGILPLPSTPGYFQSLVFSKAKWTTTELNIRGTSARHLWDYLVFPDRNHDVDIQEEEVLFLGYGIHDSRYSDYRDKKAKGKSIIIFEGEPQRENGEYWISGTEEPSFWSNTENKLKIAQRYGVKRVYIITGNIKQILADNRKKVLGGAMHMGDIEEEVNTSADHLYISTEVAKNILGSDADRVIALRDKIKQIGKPHSTKVKTEIALKLEKEVSKVVGQNVAAFIKGSELPDEYIVVSAHYDHLGKRGDDIYNGADDNGSGSTALIELLEAFNLANKDGKGPRRSILFLWLTSEERGLLGSKYYAEKPLLDINSTIANVNVDMIGRVDKNHIANPHYIYVIGSDRLSTGLHKINEEVNDKYSDLILDYTFNDEKDPNRFYYRSDHYNFAQKGVPAIFFFSGVHEDYHRTTDTVDKIMWDKMTKVTRHIFHCIWELAYREERIRVDVIQQAATQD